MEVIVEVYYENFATYIYASKESLIHIKCNILCNTIMYLTKNVYSYVHVLLTILRCDWVYSTPDYILGDKVLCLTFMANFSE
jgi:hypothetical protein